MKSIAIIPARGGSKRLPRKNILDVGGKPMIVHTIEAAIETGLFSRVIVSTEDSEVAAIAQDAGAHVEQRPEELATDRAQVKSVCIDLLDREAEKGRVHEIFCCLYATAPLRRAADIAAVMQLLDNPNVNFAFAVSAYEQPVHQALQLDEEGYLRPRWPERVNLRSQEVEQLFVGNGSTYAVRVPAFRQSASFYGPGLAGHIMPRARSVDIDTEEDLELARYYFSSLHASA